MTKEIEDKIIEATGYYCNSNNQGKWFTKGANWALSHPELMREEIEKVIGWMEKVPIVTWNKWLSNNYQPSDIFNEYLEHLKQKV